MYNYYTLYFPTAEETPVVDESEVKKNAKARIEALLTQVNDMATKSTS